MARQKDSLSLSAKKIRRRARFFLSFFFFCPKRGEACGRCNYYFDADKERSVCFEKIFLSSKYLFWFRAQSDRIKKGRTERHFGGYFDDKKISSTVAEAQNCFFSSSSSSSSSLFFLRNRHKRRVFATTYYF